MKYRVDSLFYFYVARFCNAWFPCNYTDRSEESTIWGCHIAQIELYFE